MEKKALAGEGFGSLGFPSARPSPHLCAEQSCVQVLQRASSLPCRQGAGTTSQNKNIQIHKYRCRWMAGVCTQLAAIVHQLWSDPSACTNAWSMGTSPNSGIFPKKVKNSTAGVISAHGHSRAHRPVLESRGGHLRVALFVCRSDVY